MSLITVKDLKDEGDGEIPSSQQCIEFGLRGNRAKSRFNYRLSLA
ncbi:hypothetical protein [Nostoc sp.]